jgi:hypothetical protein
MSTGRCKLDPGADNKISHGAGDKDLFRQRLACNARGDLQGLSAQVLSASLTFARVQTGTDVYADMLRIAFDGLGALNRTYRTGE